MGVEITIPKK